MATDIAFVIALPISGASPTEVLAGLPLALRTVLTLQRQGVSRFVVAVSTKDTEVQALLSKESRIKANLSFVKADSEQAALAAAAPLLGDDYMVGRQDVVVDPNVYKALMAADFGGKVAAVVGGDFVAPFRATSAFTEKALAAPSGTSIAESLFQLAVRNEVQRVDAGRIWLMHADNRNGKKRAFRELFEACRKPVDGIVSRHLNRHVSIFVSKRIVDTAISPNAVSVFTFMLAILGAYCVAQGTYFPMLAGAVLFQLNSILDGVDGELARVRFQQSKLGEWIDTVCDDLSNALYYGAMGIAAYRMGMPMLGNLGFAAVIGCFVTMLFYYTELISLGSGDFYALGITVDGPKKRGLIAAADTFFKYVLKKDFFIFAFMVAAVFGVLHWALPVVLGGTIATSVNGIVRTAKRAFRKA